METIDTNFSNNGLVVGNEAKHYILFAAKWANFLAIMGFISIGFMIIAGLFVLSIGSAFTGLPGAPPMGLFSIIYLVLGAINFFPAYYLYQFARKAKRGVTGESQQDLDLGFQNLKSLFKFIGIMTIVMIGLYIVMIVFAMIIATTIR